MSDVEEVISHCFFENLFDGARLEVFFFFPIDFPDSRLQIFDFIGTLVWDLSLCSRWHAVWLINKTKKIKFKKEKTYLPFCDGMIVEVIIDIFCHHISKSLSHFTAAIWSDNNFKNKLCFSFLFRFSFRNSSHNPLLFFFSKESNKKNNKFFKLTKTGGFFFQDKHSSTLNKIVFVRIFIFHKQKEY